MELGSEFYLYFPFLDWQCSDQCLHNADSDKTVFT